MSVFVILACVLAFACGSDAGDAEAGQQSARDRHCEAHSCPASLAEALAPVQACEESLEHSTVVEFEDGTVCVGWFDGLSGVGTCYRSGALVGGISYSDQLTGDETPEESPLGFGDLGTIPLCAHQEPGSASVEDCAPRPVARCFACWVVPNDQQLTCTAEYLEQLAMDSGT